MRRPAMTEHAMPACLPLLCGSTPLHSFRNTRMTLATERTQVLIVGAGPAGSVAAALLRKQGREVLMLEREQFPRFSIGESLLPQSMEYIEEAGLLRDVVEAGLPVQERRDLRPRRAADASSISAKVLAGLGHHLPGAARRLRPSARRGRASAWAPTCASATRCWRSNSGAAPRVTVRAPEAGENVVEAGFMLDASGFARMLPRLLKLESAVRLPGARRDLHPRRGQHPGRYVRPQQDPDHHPSRARATCGTGRSRSPTAAARWAWSPRRSFLDRYRAPMSSACRPSSARTRACRACSRTRSGTYAGARDHRLRAPT